MYVSLKTFTNEKRSLVPLSFVEKMKFKLPIMNRSLKTDQALLHSHPKHWCMLNMVYSNTGL